MKKSKCDHPTPNILQLRTVRAMSLRNLMQYPPYFCLDNNLDDLPIMSDNEVVEFFNEIDDLVKEEDSYD